MSVIINNLLTCSNFASHQYKLGKWKKSYNFKVTFLQHPLQKDSHSCGVLVMKVWFKLHNYSYIYYFTFLSPFWSFPSPFWSIQFAEYLLKQQRLKLFIDDIYRYRQEMAIKILKCSGGRKTAYYNVQCYKQTEPLDKYCRCCSYMEDAKGTDLWVIFSMQVCVFLMFGNARWSVIVVTGGFI